MIFASHDDIEEPGESPAPGEFFAPSLVWEQSSGPEGGMINDLIGTPYGAIFAATNAKVYRAYDGDNRWTRLDQTHDVRVLAIADWNDAPPVVYAGGHALLRSDDAGDTWYEFPWPIESEIRSLFVAGPEFLLGPDSIGSDDGMTLYAGFDWGGVWLSTDGGASWIGVSGEDDYESIPIDNSVESLIVGPSGRLYAGVSGLGVMSSFEGGPWSLEMGLSIAEIGDAASHFTLSVFESNPHEVLFAGTADGLFGKNDFGQWVSTGLSGGHVDDIQQVGEQFFAAVDGYLRKAADNDPFGSWGVVSDADEARVLRLTKLEGLLYAGTDRGVYGFSDVDVDGEGSVDLHFANDGLIATRISDLEVVDGRVYAGTEEGALFRSDDGGHSWGEITNDLAGAHRGRLLGTLEGALYAVSHVPFEGLLRFDAANDVWVETGLDRSDISSVAVVADPDGESVFAATFGFEVLGSDGAGAWTDVGGLWNMDQIQGGERIHHSTVGEIVSLIEHENALYVATRWGAILRFPFFDDGGWSVIPLLESGPLEDNTGSPVESVNMMVEFDGQLFIGAESGLYRLDDVTGPLIRVLDVEVLSLRVVGDALFAGIHGGLGMLPSDSITTAEWVGVDEGLQDQAILSFATSADGGAIKFYAGTAQGTWRAESPPLHLEPADSPIMLAAGATSFGDVMNVSVANAVGGIPPYIFLVGDPTRDEADRAEAFLGVNDDGTLDVHSPVPYAVGTYNLGVAVVDSDGNGTSVIDVEIHVRRIALLRVEPRTVYLSAMSAGPVEIRLMFSADPTAYTGPDGLPSTANIRFIHATAGDTSTFLKIPVPVGPNGEGTPGPYGEGAFAASIELMPQDIDGGMGPRFGRYRIEVDDFDVDPVVTPGYLNIVGAVQEGWQATLEIHDTSGTSVPQKVAIGAAVNAVDGFDAFEDIFKPPDLPDVPAITLVRDFNNSGTIEGGERLLRDIRATRDNLQWHLRVFVPDGTTVELFSPDIWDIFSYYNTALIIVQPTDERIDFQATGNVLLVGEPGGITYYLTLEVSRAHLMHLHGGWNLVSVPGPAPEANAMHFVTEEVGVDTIYGWDNFGPESTGWNPIAPVGAGGPPDYTLTPVSQGYFMHRDPEYDPTDVALRVDIDHPDARGPESGGEFLGVTVTLPTGWSLVGSPDGGSDASVFQTPANTVFGWDENRRRPVVADLLETLRGYWVLNRDDPKDVAVRQFRDTSPAVPSAPPSLGEPDWMVPLALRLSDGVEHVVELGSSRESRVAYDRLDVPQPPMPALDGLVVFYAAVDDIARRLTRSIQPVAHSGSEWTMVAVLPEAGILSWKPPQLPRGYRLLLEVDGRTVDMANRRSIRLSAGQQRFRVYTAWSPPSASRLLANYPNPFNPETWIPFELRAASEVEVRIYDMGGKTIRRLDLGYRESGYYTTRNEAIYWDGRNDSGEAAASGVYFYELRAGEFRDVRRMAILK
jgi:hypothetical protein